MVSEEQIWNYLDGSLSVADRKKVADLIATDKGIAELFEEISALHNSLKAETLLRPSLSFTDVVMASITSAPVYTPAAKPSFKLLLVFALPTIAVLIVFCVILASASGPVAYQLPFQMPVIDLRLVKIFFWTIELLLLAYFIDTFSEYRFNRKVLFS